MDQARVKYPIGEQDFKSLIEGGFVYVDKTQFVYQLTHSNKYYFLSRPRRFGKSLLLSTLRYYFEGKKELFEGLAIEQMETEWKQYPVFLISLAQFNPDVEESLQKRLLSYIREWESLYGKSDEDLEISDRFSQLIKKSHEITGEKVVILVDEYDAPLISTLHDDPSHEKFKNELKSFYTNLKDNGEHIRFAMLTGVSRFSHMSIFSGLNNLKDVTLVDTYGALCGITFDEILKYFQRGIAELSEELKLDPDSTLHELRKYYDGYHFSKRCPDIYNPFSLLNAFADKELRSYWMRTGTPTFLVKRLIEDRVDLKALFNAQAPEQSLAETDLSYSSPVSLLFQTGYLTIKGYDEEWRLYRLGIPNKEVEDGLFEGLMNFIRGRNSHDNVSRLRDLVIALREGGRPIL